MIPSPATMRSTLEALQDRIDRQGWGQPAALWRIHMEHPDTAVPQAVRWFEAQQDDLDDMMATLAAALMRDLVAHDGPEPQLRRALRFDDPQQLAALVLAFEQPGQVSGDDDDAGQGEVETRVIVAVDTTGAWYLTLRPRGSSEPPIISGGQDDHAHPCERQREIMHLCLMVMSLLMPDDAYSLTLLRQGPAEGSHVVDVPAGVAQ